MADQSRLEIVIDSRGAEASARGVRRELEGMERAGNTATRAARSTAGGFGRIARSSQLAVPPVGQLTRLLGGLSGIIGARQVINYADAWQNAGNQLRQVTGSAEELAGTQERLMQVANNTRADFGSTANLYSRLARSTTELGLSQDDLIGLTRTINQSFATSGATATEAAGAITQLSQGLAAGALRGDEFNSVSEQAPGIMRAIAESLDMTIGELRDFAAEGGITAEIVVKALQDSADAIENDFGRAVATFGQNMTVARNNLIQFVGDSDTVEEGVANIGESIVGLSENLEGVGQAATVVAGIFAGRLAGRFVTVAAGMATAAGAATALRTALAFLGGPAGVAVLAASGLFAFREELGLVPAPVEAARDEIDLLVGSMEDLGAASIDAAMIAINAQMFDLERRARQARAEIDRINDAQNVPGPLRNSLVGPAGGAQRELADIQAEQSALSGRQDELLALREGLDAAGNAGDGTADALGRLGTAADDLADKFKPMLDDDVQDILDRAGPGATIDKSGQLRDAFGNPLRTMQRDLDRVLKDQVDAFSSEQNLKAGLEAAAEKFVGGATEAAAQAWNSITPVGAESAAGSLMATNSQDSAPGLAKPPSLGTMVFKLEGKDGQGGEVTVEGRSDDLRRMADVFSGVASAS